MDSEEKNPVDETLQDRLAILRGGRSMSAFAAAAGIHESVMRKYCSGVMPGLDRAAVIAEANGVSLDWLATGKGEKVIEGPDAEFAYIDNLKVEAAAGPGSAVESEVVNDRMAFRRDWLRRHNLQEEHLCFITARGDSMDPTIRSGDTLLVHVYFHTTGTKSRQQIVQGLDPKSQAGLEGIFVLRMDDGLVVKRLQPDLKGGYTIKSDSGEYDDLHAKSDQLTIVGRVEWIGRRI